jgi:fimbrial chaperone protein
MRFLFRTLSLLFVGLAANQTVQAGGFGISNTRLIYPEGAPSVSLTLRNTQSDSPYLVHTTISAALDGKGAAPFLVSPPLFRLEPNSSNQIRISAHGGGLPSDRESVFYINARAIPSSTAGTEEDQQQNVGGEVKLGVANVIKLFYRPSGLTPSVADAHKNLQITLVKEGLQVYNASPYFINFAGIRFGGEALSLASPGANMIAPFSSHIFATKVKQGEVDWRVINDLGGIDAFTKMVP